MSEPTKEQIDKWRSEFEEINKPHDYFKVKSGKYRSSIVQRMWRNYLAAKKSDFEEIKTLKEQLAKAVRSAEFYQSHADCKRDSWTCRCSFCRDTESSKNLREAREFLEKQNQNKEKKDEK